MSTAPVVEPAAAPLDDLHLATAELELGGMHCSACATRIQKTLGRLPAVASASVNLATTRAFVSYDPTLLDTDQLCRAVSDVGYTAAPVVDDRPEGGGTDPDHWLARAAISWPLALAAMVVSLAAPETATAGWTVLVLAVVVEIAGGWPFLRDSARLLRHGATSMDTLIALGTLAALSVSAVEAIALGGRHVHLGGSGAFAARLHGVMAPLIVSILVTGRAIEETAVIILESLKVQDEVDADKILKDISMALPYDNPEKILHTMVAWGRYAGLMDYNANTNTIFIPKDEDEEAGAA